MLKKIQDKMPQKNSTSVEIEVGPAEDDCNENSDNCQAEVIRANTTNDAPPEHKAKAMPPKDKGFTYLSSYKKTGDYSAPKKLTKDEQYGEDLKKKKQ
jgi:hypothetical protein